MNEQSLEVLAPGRRFEAQLDEGGGYEGPDLRPDDYVSLTNVYDPGLGWGGTLVRQHWRLQGAGPWTLKVPDGRVRVLVVAPNGMPIEADAFLDENAFEIPRDGLTLLGLPLTPQRLFVGAAHHRTAVVDFTPAPGDAAPTLRIVLPPRH
jgi:hypothetical protein